MAARRQRRRTPATARRSGRSPRLPCPTAPFRAWGSSQPATLARRSRKYPRHRRPPPGPGRQATGPRPRRSTFLLACRSTYGSSAGRSSALPCWPPPSRSLWPGYPYAGSRSHRGRMARAVLDGALRPATPPPESTAFPCRTTLGAGDYFAGSSTEGRIDRICAASSARSIVGEVSTPNVSSSAHVHRATPPATLP